MEEEFYIEENYGTHRALVIRNWSEKCEQFLYENKLEMIVLNDARGWKDKSVKFLKELKLKRLSIITYNRPLRDLNVLSSVRGLKSLSLQTKSSKKVDLSEISELEYCSLNYEEDFSSIFKSLSLRNLSLNYFPFHSLEKIKELKNLEKLNVGESKLRNLNGVEALSESLLSLELIFLRQLKNCDSVGQLKHLQELVILKCKKLEDLSSLSNLVELKELKVDDCAEIQSLEPLKKLIKLRKVSFRGTTNILDGDFSHLSNLPVLKKISFENRKHYSHKDSIIFGFSKKWFN